jgi:predicted transglutaminase-like cysteine proteinase
MLSLGQSRKIPRAISLAVMALFTVAAMDGAQAEPRSKRTAARIQLASLVSPLQQQAMPVVRFFTINDVLAKRAGQTSGGVKLASLASPIAPQPSNEPFGLVTFRAPEGLLTSKWHSIEQELKAEAKLIERCKSDPEDCSNALSAFMTIASVNGNADLATQVARVNRSVNQRIRYVSDLEQHGVADRWSSPLATMAVGRGDCEDYAILKLAVLRHQGVAAEDLKLVLVRDRAVRQDHAVLMVRIENRWRVLDNRSSLVLEVADVPNFMPLFALDERGVNLFAAPYDARPTDQREAAALPAAAVEAAGGGTIGLPILL